MSKCIKPLLNQFYCARKINFVKKKYTYIEQKAPVRMRDIYLAIRTTHQARKYFAALNWECQRNANKFRICVYFLQVPAIWQCYLCKIAKAKATQQAQLSSPFNSRKSH